MKIQGDAMKTIYALAYTRKRKQKIIALENKRFWEEWVPSPAPYGEHQRCYGCSYCYYNEERDHSWCELENVPVNDTEEWCIDYDPKGKS